MKLRIVFFTLLLLVYLQTTSWAQYSGAAGTFSRLGFGPRGMATSNALIAEANSAFSYYNPAHAAHAPNGNQVDISTAAMSFDRSLNTAAGTFRLPPTGGATLSVINASVQNIDGRSSSGYDTGTLSTNEYQIAAALGVKLRPNFSAGVGLKYYISDLHNNLPDATTLGMDIGLHYFISKHLQVGIAIKDLLASYNWNSGALYNDNSSSRVDDFPRRLQLGLAYWALQNLHVYVSGGHAIHDNGSRNNLRLGSAYRLHERITIRGGWQIDALSSLKNSNHLSTGFSIHLPFDFWAPSIDYAFVQEPNNLSIMHTFGLQLTL